MSKYTIKSPKVGEVLESADWYRSDNERRASAIAIRIEFANTERQFGLILGPITWQDMKVGDEHTPDPPGPEYKLLRGEAKVACYRPVLRTSYFVNELDAVDLARLRIITRRAHHSACPRERALTDAQCDTVINEHGPRHAENAIREAVDARVVN